MPIRPETLARYPADWPAIRARIQRRAANKCEQCGVANHALGGRLRDGRFMLAMPLGEKLLRLEWPRPGVSAWCADGERYERLRVIRIVCTVAHLDHMPENCDDDNLRFWCQRCHLSYDVKHHGTTAYMARREARGIDWIGA